MKILLLGRDGQVGWELQRSLAPLGDVVALGRDASRNFGGLCGDLTQLEGLAHTVRTVKPAVIVNAAAHTAVDRAEAEADLAHRLNTLAPAILADEAQRLGAWLVHYSTDYVFDGSGDVPWREDAVTAPLSVYGLTKRDGELAVARCQRHLVFRTSWVYAARGGNFAKTMVRLAQQRETLQVINDQHGAPTGADLIADLTAHAIRQAVQIPPQDTSAADALAGVYHLAAAGETTWFEYAKFVLSEVERAQPAIQLIAKNVTPVASSAFPTAARRPLNSRLNTAKLKNVFGLELPHWQMGVSRLLSEVDLALAR